MDRFLPDSVMLDALKKVQEFQIDIIASGRNCHVDGGTYRSYADHIGFDVTVFEDAVIVKQFEFSALDSKAEVDAEIACLAAFVERIKEEEDR